MNRDALIESVDGEPLFTTGMLLSPGVNLGNVQKQLSRWTTDGTVVQLRRGLYALGPRYRVTDPHPYAISNALVQGSYVSMETVLADTGLIPEAVFSTTAVTTGRQGTRKTPFGMFVYQHIKPELFWGYEPVSIDRERVVFIASAEKALLDMAYLRTCSGEPEFVRELRLQRLELIDTKRLTALAARFGSKKVEQFARNVVSLAESERGEYRGT